jgi:hypothetical protein
LAAEFTAAGDLFECVECAALVSEDGRERHVNWHDRLDGTE